MTYYKVIHKETGELYYASCELSVKGEKMSEILGLDEYTFEVISKEEYDKGTGD